MSQDVDTVSTPPGGSWNDPDAATGRLRRFWAKVELLEQEVHALPAPARVFFEKYRDAVQRAGRFSAEQSWVDYTREYVRQLQLAFDAQWELYRDSAPLGNVGVREGMEGREDPAG
jgi:hypothetical protein